MQSNTTQPNPIKIPRPKSYLNPNLKNQKTKTNWWRIWVWWFVSLSLCICLFVSQYLLDLSSYLILTGDSSLYLCISLSPNRFNKLYTFMVWVLDDEEGVWPWSVFWNWRSGIGKEKGNGRNRKSEFSLLYSRVLCIIRLEKKKLVFLFSLFLRIRASLLNAMY